MITTGSFPKALTGGKGAKQVKKAGKDNGGSRTQSSFRQKGGNPTKGSKRV